MKKKILLIGIPIVVVGIAIAGMSMRGKGDESLSVETAKASHEKIVQKVNKGFTFFVFLRRG